MIFNERNVVENGLKIEKGMELVISVEYLAVEDKNEEIVIKYSYLRDDKLWREESERINII